jgi:hypothetical protein
MNWKTARVFNRRACGHLGPSVEYGGGAHARRHFDENNATGVVTPQTTNPSPHDWLYDPNGPPSNLTDRALFQALSNDNGWTHHDVNSLCSAAPPGTDVSSYMGVITTANHLYLSENGSCWLFYDDMPTSQFTPFTEVGSPATADIVAALYTTEHGNRLYVVIQP